MFIYKGWWMRLAKYPSVSWRVNGITISKNSKGMYFYRVLKNTRQHHSNYMNCSPHYHLYPVYKEGGIHSIRHIGWKGWFIYPFTLKTPCKWHNFYIACLHNIIDFLDVIYIARNRRVVFKHTREEQIRIFLAIFSLYIIGQTNSLKIFQ